MLFAVTVLLMPSRLQSPSLCPVETIAAPSLFLNGAERNRTAVRNTGVDHLVHLKMNISILPVIGLNGSIFNYLDKNNFIHI